MQTFRQLARRSLLGLFAGAATAGCFIAPAGAQFFGERFPFFDERPLFDQRPRAPVYAPPVQRAAPVDNSHAPAPRKYDKNEDDLSTVVVMGDAMADWLGYGLESAFSDSPEITVVRKYRSGSSLVFNEPGRGPRSRQFDWAAAAREILAKDKASVVVMMIGLGDRVPIRETQPVKHTQKAAQPKGGKDATKTAGAKPADGKPADAKPADAKTQAANSEGEGPADPPAADQANADDSDDPPEPQRGGSGTYEFKSEKWVEAYNKRLDDVIVALRSKNVPVIWVGLPPVRGPRAMTDMAFLNDLYRARAQKAGIYYVDVWDAFVDESGRFAQSGPDFEGQNRRLRSGDGVYFTLAGARKLAHYVDKEIRRAMMPSGPIAIPLPVEPGTGNANAAPATAPDNSVARPLAGPVIPLNATGSDMASDTTELAGGGSAKQTISDETASRVLAKGEAMPIPAGRADDFVWPRRGPALFDADPAVARTTLPMTPMQAERPGVEKVAAAPEKPQQPHRPRVSRVSPERREARRFERQPEPQQQSPFFFFFNAR